MAAKWKSKKAWGSIFLVGTLGIFLFGGSVVDAKAAEKEETVNVLFTHDTHSHLNSFNTVYNGEDTNIGGFARIKTIIDDQKEKDPDTLVVDGGDFAMGTLFQTIYEEDASELRMLGYLGYDATTLGNHEFDYRSNGLHNMLETAVDSGDTLPQLVLCNVDWSGVDASEDQQLIKEAFDDYGVKDYTIVEKNGIHIALIGVFGKDALACAPTCALNFEDPVEAVKETVAEIKANEDVDMIVALSHCGTTDDEDTSEDEILAKSVPELDLIISGHTHTVLEEPLVHGNTAIVSCGEYGENVGSLSMVRGEDGRWTVDTYDIIPVTEDIESDEGTQNKISSFKHEINDTYLAQFDYKADEILAHNEYDFSTVSDLQNIHTEHNLGDLISDSYRYGVEEAEGYDGVPVDVTVVPSGTVRDTYLPGDITVEDVFNSFSLGIGPDGVPGYPIISIYLTGAELKTSAEIDASVSDYMPTARLYMSGLNFTYNPNRMILNRVTDVYLTDGTNRTEIEDDKLYRVVADLYSGQMLSAVTETSHGLLSVVPKYADGTPVEDMEDCIVYNGDQELKAWVSIAEYMNSFDAQGTGTPQVPEYYNELHDRKVVDDSKDIATLVKNPNKYAAMIMGAAVAIIAVIVLLVMGVIKVVKIRKKKAKVKKK